MPQEETALTWLEVLRYYWPLWVALVAAVGAVGELRVRKLLDARDVKRTEELEKIKVDLRTELQTPVMNVGKDAMEALEKANKHEPRIVELETKTAVFWKMIERSTADLLRHVGEDREK